MGVECGKGNFGLKNRAYEGLAVLGKGKVGPKKWSV
jgi:hypothetical protein